MIGKVVSHYRVIQKLGGGGMGVVYRARDTKLGRDVALKFLPEEMNRDSAATERFRREARSAAAINHPNICTVYEIGEHEGHPFLAMELLDGATLKHKAGGKPVPVDSLLDWAIQIADGLEAAHARGIVHRDIKPANLFITSTAHAKILDFGLAKLTAEATSAPAGVNDASITLLDPVTNPGVVAGSPHYMSPEQARGEQLDFRTDLFSFGAVLYEMATGRVPFEGASNAVILASILRDDPKSPAGLNPALPPKFVDIIAKLLEKDREMRYQSAADLRADLKRLQRHSVTGQTAAVQEPRTVAGTGKKWIWLGAVAAVLAIFGAIYVFRQPGSRKYFENIQLTQLTTTGSVLSAAISRDGKYLAYLSAARGAYSLRVRQIATGTDLEIVPPSPGWSYIPWSSGISFSPDGNYVYFIRRREGRNLPDLFRVPSLGGEPHGLTENVECAPAFSPDERHIAFTRMNDLLGEASLLVMNSDGGGERVLKTWKHPNGFPLESSPAWSPDGKLIAFARSEQNGSGDFRLGIVVFRWESGSQQTAGSAEWLGISRMNWLPDGRGLIVSGRLRTARNDQLYVVSYPVYRARQVTNDLSVYRQAVTTADGVQLAAVRTEDTSNLWVIPSEKVSAPKTERGATQVTFASAPEGNVGLAWLRDGKLAYSMWSGEHTEIAVVDANAAGQPKQLTQSAFIQGPVAFSACGDGRTVVYSSRAENAPGIWRMDVDGGNAKRLTRGPGDLSPSCSPDGRWVAFGSVKDRQQTIWRVSIDGGEPVRLTDTPGIVPMFSPDGANIAFASETQSGKLVLRIIPIAAGKPPLAVGEGFISYLVYHWAPNGLAIDYFDYKDGVRNIWRLPLDGTPPKQITHLERGTFWDFAWSADGKKLALARGTRTSDVVLIRDKGPGK
jgi:Tol biopolymer transport system component/tRNA A-37 threonylcarbamoyl transferase component Bud32